MRRPARTCCSTARRTATTSRPTRCSGHGPTRTWRRGASPGTGLEGAMGVTVLADGPAWFDTTIDRTIVLLRLYAVAHVEYSLPLVFHRSRFGLSRATEGLLG